MEHVQLTAEARARILKNIENAGKADSSNTDSRKANVVSFRNWQRYGALAACLVLLGVLAAILPSLRKPSEDLTTSVSVADYWAAEYDTLQDMSNGVGFPIEDVRVLPFSNPEISYLSITDTIAQTKLETKDQVILFRKSKGSEDNSGDYNTYESIKKIKVNNFTVTLKCSSNFVKLALWENAGYFYSMRFDTGISKETAQSYISAIMN